MEGSSEMSSDWLAAIVSFLAQFVATVTAAFLLGSVNPQSFTPFRAAGIVALFVSFGACVALLALWKAGKIGNWLRSIGVSLVGVVIFSGIGFYLASRPQTPPLTQAEIALTQVASETHVASTRVVLVLGATETVVADRTRQFEDLFKTAEAELRVTHLWEEALTAVSVNATATQETSEGTAVAVANSTIVAQNTAQAALIATEVAIAAAATAQAAVVATQAAAATATEIAALATPNPAISRGNCEQTKPPCTHHIVEGDSYTEIAYENYGYFYDAAILINYNRHSNGNFRHLRLEPQFLFPLRSCYPHCRTHTVQLVVIFPVYT
jgi:hypothetical protein